MTTADLEAKIIKTGRPRLFFNAAGLADLKKQIATTHRAKWDELKAAVDAVVNENPPEYRGIEGDPTRPGTPNDEMLYQRNYGYRVPALALVALIDPDPKYFEAARKWALKPVEYPLWGAGVFKNSDLAAGHVLYGLSIAYDWLYDRWSDQDRKTLRAVLSQHGRDMYEAAEGIAPDVGWWRHSWRQNHSFISYGGLGLAATALAGEEPNAGVWFAKVQWAYQHIFGELPNDGSYEEGVPYWGYGFESLLRVITALRPFFETDFYATTNLRSGHLFRLHMAGPEMPQIANFGDGLTRDWHVMRTLMYRLAAEFRNPLAQWLAEALPVRQEPDPALYSLLWYDPTVSAQRPADTPLWHVFPETGFAGMRTGWDKDALTVHFRSGQVDVSHSHFDVNDFLLNAGGEFLLQDYGYGKVGPGYFNRETMYFSNATVGHNCLIIGGRNQRKGPDAKGVITHWKEQNNLLWLRSDATACYDNADSVARELVLRQPGAGTGRWGYVVVRDLARTPAPEQFDFMLQPGGEVLIDGSRFEIRGQKARLIGVVLAPQGATISLMPGLGEHINVPRPFTMRIAAPEKATSAQFIVAFVPLADGETAPDVSSPSAGVVRIGSDELVFSSDGTAAPARR